MKTLALAASLLAVALAGCTGAADTDAVYQVPPMEGGKYVIQMTNGLKFLPEYVEVPVGATVLWKNMGGAHNVVPRDDAWTPGPVDTGDFEITVTEVMLGEHAYYCQPHEAMGMEGVLRVVPADG